MEKVERTKLTEWLSKGKAHKSTVEWLWHYAASDSYDQRIVDKIAKSTPSSSNSNRATPVNIILFEGGGLRGYAHIGMLKGLLELNGGEDFLHYFDLAGGTSVGGVASQLTNRAEKANSVVKLGEELLNDAYQTTCSNVSWKRFLFHSSLTSKKNDLVSVYRRHYGTISLYNPGSLKAFALSAAKGRKGTSAAKSVEPFVFRTYDLPTQEKKRSPLLVEECAGSNEEFLWEALGATSAAPVLTEQIQLNIRGEQRSFADGAVIANNPFAVAMTEAMRLWPSRPIGVVLVLGLDDFCSPVVSKAVNVVRESNPGMSYVKFRPPNKVGKFMEKDERRLRECVADAKKYILESKEALDIMKRLKSSGSRRMTDEKTLENANHTTRSFANLTDPMKNFCPEVLA